MYLTQFPDIKWLRKSAKANFSNGIGYQGKKLVGKGWPNVVMDTTASEIERDEIKGPFSLFANLSGQSRVRLGNKWYSVDEHTFCLSNPGETYHLHVDKAERTKLFNIHFGQELFEDVAANLSLRTSDLLDNPRGLRSSFGVLPKLSLKDPTINEQLNKVRSLKHESEQTLEYEHLGDLLALVLRKQVSNLEKIDGIATAKPATRKELFARLSIAIDYMHENLHRTFDLDELSRQCGLSKFHFIRTFKEAYGISPNRFFSRLRFEKATQLLEESGCPIIEVSSKLGFSEPSAFSRFFKRHELISPKHFIRQ